MSDRKPEEPSHMCSKCHHGPFTGRGLKTHNCAKRSAHPERYTNFPHDRSLTAAPTEAPQGPERIDPEPVRGPLSKTPVFPHDDLLDIAAGALAESFRKPKRQ